MAQGRYAEERPIELQNNGKRIAAFLCTPHNLTDLATGHLLTRGLITSTREIQTVEEDPQNGIVNVITAQDLGKELYSVPEFVICGNSTVSHFSENIGRILPKADAFTIPLYLLQALAQFMVNAAPLYHETGGIHAALVAEGEQVILREDIGRHSAVDKAVGAAVHKVDFSHSVICTTGRISLDMLLKSAAVGLPVIVSLKVLSDMAVELAAKYNITVVGQVLREQPVVHTAPQRILY